jgi:AcrR family transcriptional regulator
MSCGRRPRPVGAARCADASSRWRATSFAERGFRDTRVSDITQGAGTAQGNFYRHFANKNDILLAVLGDPLDELLELATPPFSADAAPGLEALIEWNTAYFTVYHRHRGIYRVMREAAAAAEDAGFAELWKGQRQRFVARVREWLEALDAAGQLRAPADRTLMAEAMLSMRENLSYVHIALADDVSEQRIVDLGAMVGLLWFRCLDLEEKRSRKRNG